MVILDISSHDRDDTKPDHSIRTTTSYKVANHTLVPVGTLVNTFENDAAGFRVTFPGDWSFGDPENYAKGIALNLDSPSAQTKAKSPNYEGGYTFTITDSASVSDFIKAVDSNSTATTLSGLLTELKSKGTLTDYSSVTIGSGSYAAYAVTGYATLGLAEYWVVNKSHVYDISIGTDLDASNTILKSLVLL